MVHTPVLLIMYNRFENAQKIVDVLREQKASVLYIAGDGAKNNPEDAERVRLTREKIRASIDWECEVHYRFAPENQGCKYGPINAMNWVFENEERAIILEDDIVPGTSFFPFCEELLERFEDDRNVGMVAGCNVMDITPDARESYFFEPIATTWGWATWRRAWSLYAPSMPEWEQMKKERTLYRLFPRNTAFSLARDFNTACCEEKDVWDYQWQYTMLRHHMCGVVPSRCLINNIGLGDLQATHTGEKFLDFTAHELDFPLVHAKEYIGNEEYTDYCEKYVNYVNYWHLFLKKILPDPIVRKIREYRQKRRGVR